MQESAQPEAVDEAETSMMSLDFCMTNDINNILEELAKNRRFLVFAGAGVNTGTGIPESWRKLIEALHKKKPIKDIDVDKLSEEDFPKVAQRFYDAFTLTKENSLYYDTIKNELRATNAPFSTSLFWIYFVSLYLSELRILFPF